MVNRSKTIFTDPTYLPDEETPPRQNTSVVTKTRAPLRANSSNYPRDSLQSTKANKERRKLHNLMERSNRVIFKCSTVFPFDFFTDTLIIDEKKVSIIAKIFFFSETVHTILLSNLLDVEIDTSLFFATMKLIPNTMPNEPVILNFLEKSKAHEARRIIEGLLICEKEHIDLSALSKDDLRNNVQVVGTALGDA